MHETVGLKEACVAMFGHGGAEHWLYRLLGRLQMTQEAFPTHWRLEARGYSPGCGEKETEEWDE